MLFQIFALLILSAFYVCYFAKMISQRKKGIKTDQLGSGKIGFVKLIEVSLKAFSIILPAAECVSIIMNTSSLPLWARIAGGCMGAAGVAVFLLSVITMKDNWRAGVSKTDKTDLVTDGVYKISRNPAFLGFDLVYIGILLMFFNWVLFALTLITAVIFHLQIVNVEEDHLISAFGDEYLEYRKKVCRYLGRRFWR